MSIVDSGVRLRANDTTYSLAGNADLTDKKVIVYNDGNIGLELVDTDHVLALSAHVKVEGAEKAFRDYVGESLGYGYWQGENFGYIHQWDTVENKPLLYQYPFSGAGTDLDFPVVGSICSNRVGDWWLGVGGWFEISTPTWTDPSWDWVSSAVTLYTDKTKCSGVVYAYKVGATYYLRIWTLTDGVWGYVTESGWGGIDLELERFTVLAGIWEWDGDIYYITFSYDSYYYKNGLLIKEVESGGESTKILVSDTYTYIRGQSEAGYPVAIHSKTDFEGWGSEERIGYITLINTDKCIVTGWYRYWPGTEWKYKYINGKIVSAAVELPSGGNDNGYFDGGEGGKALQNCGGSGGYSIIGFDPVANTWTDYGRPWG